MVQKQYNTKKFNFVIVGTEHLPENNSVLNVDKLREFIEYVKEGRKLVLEGHDIFKIVEVYLLLSEVLKDLNNVYLKVDLQRLIDQDLLKYVKDVERF